MRSQIFFNIGSISFYNSGKFVDNPFFCSKVIVLLYKTWYCGHTQIFDPIQYPLAGSVNLQISTGLSGRLSKMYKQVFLKEKQHDKIRRSERAALKKVIDKLTGDGRTIEETAELLGLGVEMVEEISKGY